MNEADVWVIHARKEILVTDAPGVPAIVCGWVSAEAKQAAEAGGRGPTLSEIGFSKDDYLGHFEIEGWGWGQADEVAEAKAKELGYRVVHESIFMDGGDEGDEDDGTPFDYAESWDDEGFDEDDEEW